MIRQSICYPLFKDLAASPAEFCRLAAEMGYAGIDLWGRGELEGLHEPAARHNLTLTGFVGHGPIERGLNNPEHHAAIQRELRESIDLAARHRVPTLIAFAGNRMKNQSDYEGLVQCARGLRPVAPYAAERGVTLCVEMLNSKVDHPHYLADRSDFAFALCEMVGSPAVKVLFDIYYMQVMEGDVIASLRRGLQWVGHVHTAGVPGRHDLDDTQELNYRGIVHALQDGGYTGFVGHEFWARGDKLAAMRQAFALCRLA
mgnify:CR=1 FL=1